MGWNDKDDKYNRGSAWFYSTAFIAFSRFSSGQLKRALWAGILRFTEENSCARWERTNAQRLFSGKERIHATLCTFSTEMHEVM